MPHCNSLFFIGMALYICPTYLQSFLVGAIPDYHILGKSSDTFHLLSYRHVPKGWDKLFLSVVSVETGKTIVKSSKAPVYGGTCQWTETFSESVWAYRYDASKDIEECHYKIIVAMGSARSGILGELILNLSDYITSGDSDPLPLPLKKCNYGTILQIKIQCHSSRTNSRDRKPLKGTTYLHEGVQTTYEDMVKKSGGSDNMFNKNEASFSALGSHPSSDSGGSPVGRINISPRNNLNDEVYIRRQGSADSHISLSPVTDPGDDFSKSNPSSFNSRVSGTSVHTNQWQEITSQTSVHGTAPLSLKHSDSSKDILEVAEETIDELRDEAKMWERHSQKLKLDIEKLKRDSSEKFKHQVDQEMELSAACADRDSLKKEVEQLKSSLDEAMTKHAVCGTSKIGGILHVKSELESEIKFQKETNANLTLQLEKTQEANIELVSILQELEETVEKQSLEIANISQKSHVDEHEGGLRSQILRDIEAVWENKLSAKEEKINKLEEKLSVILNAEHSSKPDCSEVNAELVRQIGDLKAKVQELETDCTELTDENLELIFKIKKSSEKSEEEKASLNSLFNEPENCTSHDNFEFDILLLKSQKDQLEDKLRMKDLVNDNLTVALKVQIRSLEEKCADLELELQHCKEQANNLDTELQKEKLLEFTKLQERLLPFKDSDSECFDSATGIRNGEVEKRDTTELSCKLSEINKQVHIAMSCLRTLGFSSECNSNTESIRESEFVNIGSKYTVSETELAAAILSSILELNSLLAVSISKNTNFTEDQNPLDGKNMKEQKHLKSPTKVESGNEDTDEEIVEIKSKMEGLKALILIKEKETDILRDSNRNLEDLIFSMQGEKAILEANLVIALIESNITFKCLDDVQNDILILTRNIQSQLSTNKMLERKSLELENIKCELELHISELEEQNIQLSKHISDSELQLRYVMDEKKVIGLELEDCRSFVSDLKDEITKQQTEWETKKAVLRNNLQQEQNNVSEAREELECVKRYRSKLQARIESVIEECSSLQKLTEDLRRQNTELHERITCLEVELMESQNNSFKFSQKVKFLEEKLSSLQNDIISKEQSLISQVECILLENKAQEEKISKAYFMLDQLELAKRVEVKNLERQMEHYTLQSSSTLDGREKIASDAVLEVFSLQSEKNKLESCLQEPLEKVNLYEAEINSFGQECENKVEKVVEALDASEQSEERLMANTDHMQWLMDSVKVSEESFKRVANELELKLKASDYEKQQMLDERSSLKVQLQQITHLQDEISTLINSLDEAKSEKGKLEMSQQVLSEECEELKTERVSFVEKMSKMQKALHDAGDGRHSRIVLEEKLFRVEGDLNATQSSCEAESRDELNHIKQTNSYYQRKIQCMEEKDEPLRKSSDTLQKELVLKKEEFQGEGAMHEGDDKLQDHAGKLHAVKQAELESRIHLLEIELARSLEINNMYKLQLPRSLSKNQDGDDEASQKSISESDTRSDNSSRIKLLETQLKEMEERFLHMSLQYAEVEAQREELVMQLKSTKQGKRWF